MKNPDTFSNMTSYCGFTVFSECKLNDIFYITRQNRLFCFKYTKFRNIYDIYLLLFGFHPVAVVGKLVQEKGNRQLCTKGETIHKKIQKHRIPKIEGKQKRILKKYKESKCHLLKPVLKLETLSPPEKTDKLLPGRNLFLFE